MNMRNIWKERKGLGWVSTCVPGEEAWALDGLAADIDLSHGERSSYEGADEETAEEMEEPSKNLRGVHYHMSHHLRAPLRAIQGFSAELLETYGDAPDGRSRELLQRIGEASIRMDRLIQSLQEYGELSHREFICHTVKLQRVVDAVIWGMSEESAKGVTVEVVQPLPEVWTSATILEEILINVVRNAITYVEPGTTPEVRIWAEQKGKRVEISVKDNGIGIAKEHQQRIFWIFERLGPVLNHSGTGMGLALVQKGMSRLGGSVRVESEPGMGSRFVLELPGRQKGLDIRKAMSCGKWMPENPRRV